MIGGEITAGLKVKQKNFGRDRRYPIVNRFRDKGEGAHQSDPVLTPKSSVAASTGSDL